MTLTREVGLPAAPGWAGDRPGGRRGAPVVPQGRRPGLAIREIPLVVEPESHGTAMTASDRAALAN